MTTSSASLPTARLLAVLGTLVALLAASLLAAGPAQATGIPYGQPVIKVGSPTKVFGDFVTCISWQKSPRQGSSTCSKSYTLKHRQYGEAGISNSALSAKLGFEVTQSTTARASHTINYRKGDRGRIEIRAVYTRYPVSKTITHCNRDGYNCHTHTTTGTVWKFRGFYNYRSFINGKRV